MTLNINISPLHPRHEAVPWAVPSTASWEATQGQGHSYLQGHFLEVTASPADDVAQEEDGAVGMLCAVAAALQVGLVGGCQHIHPAWRGKRNPLRLPLCLSRVDTITAETTPTPSVHSRNGSLLPASSPSEPLHCWPRGSPHKGPPGQPGTRQLKEGLEWSRLPQWSKAKCFCL